MQLVKDAPPLSDFIAFRANEGWGEISQETAEASLSASLVNVCAFEGERLAGFGRVVGDGHLYFYIQDLIVAPTYRGRGVGKQIMERLIEEIKNRATSGAMIGLMSAHGKEAFYKKFGFIVRPNDVFGAGMIRLL